MAGDDIQDDFIPDNFVALSDNEQSDLESLENENQAPNTSTTVTATAAKRKRRLKEKERKAKVNYRNSCGRAHGEDAIQRVHFFETCRMLSNTF